MQTLAKRILIVLVALYFVACGVLYFGQDKLLFHPPPLAANYHFQFPGKFEEFNLKMEDGSIINAVRFFSSDSAKGVVLYFHGNAGNIQREATRASYFNERGYDCIMMDYPSFGKSTGKLSEVNLFRIAHLSYEDALKKNPAQNIVLFGRSLGTGIAAHVAAEADCKALILEAPYYSMIDVAQSRYKIFPVSWLCEYPLRTDECLPKVKAPVYIIHGTDDEVIPYASPQKFLALPLARLTFITVPGGHHNNLAETNEYAELLNNALK